MSKALLKNILHILEAMLLGYVLMLWLSIQGYLVGGAILLVMWLLCYMGIKFFRTPVINKTVKNKTGVTIDSTAKQWLIGMSTCMLGYAIGALLFYIIGGIL